MEEQNGVLSLSNDDSYFDGGVFQCLGWKILGMLITGITLGICYPFAVCWMYDWEAKHTVINGRRLKFTGTAGGLFGTWILCLLLSIVTLGIYGFYVPIKIRKWRESNTFFEDEIPTFDSVQKLKAEKASYFDGGFWQLFGWELLGGIITIFTFGICYPWAVKMIYSWEQRHKVYNHKRCTFDGSAGGLFGTWLLCMLLSVITLGIYTLWVPLKIKKWQIKHTHLLEDETSAEEQEEKKLTPEEIEAKKIKKENDRKTFKWVFLSGIVVMTLSLFCGFYYVFEEIHFWFNYNPFEYFISVFKLKYWYMFFTNYLNVLFYLLELIGIIVLIFSISQKPKKQKYNNILDLIGLITIGLCLLYRLGLCLLYRLIYALEWEISISNMIEYLVNNMLLIIGYVATIVGFVKTKN